MDPKKPKITPEQLDMFTYPMVDIYRALETEIFVMIAKRLKTSKDLSHDNVFEWQVDKLNQLRLIKEETIKLLAEATSLAEKEIRKAIRDTGIVTIESVDEELKDIYPALPMPSHIDQILESYANQTFREMNNYVNQTLITTNFGQGTVTDMYRKIVEETTGKVLGGVKTTNQAIVETVIKWANKGVNTGFVDRGGNIWTLERYAQTVIRSTVNRTYNELRMSRMEEYGVDLVLVSSLPDPRDICSHIQGKVASMKEPSENNSKYPSVYEFGYGEPGGIRGINCRHMFFPFIEGINENNQRQYSEAEMTKNREQRQKQRYYERQIRMAKRSLRIAEEVGDEETIKKYRNLVSKRRAAMRKFINETGRTREYAREQIHA